MLRKLLGYVPLGLLLTGVWVILNERLDLPTLVFGVAAAVLGIVATNRLVLKARFTALYKARPLRMLLYAVRLVVSIYVAGFQAIGKMLTRRVHVGIVDIETRLDDPFAVALLANSITLTPGTVTLSQEDNRLKIIWLDTQTHDPAVAGPAIMGPFEKLLEEAVR